MNHPPNSIVINLFFNLKSVITFDENEHKQTLNTSNCDIHKDFHIITLQQNQTMHWADHTQWKQEMLQENNQEEI